MRGFALDRRTLLAGLGLAGMGSVAAAAIVRPAFAADSADARLDALLAAQFEAGLRDDPTRATSLGLDTGALADRARALSRLVARRARRARPPHRQRPRRGARDRPRHAGRHRPRRARQRRVRPHRAPAARALPLSQRRLRPPGRSLCRDPARRLLHRRQHLPRQPAPGRDQGRRRCLYGATRSGPGASRRRHRHRRRQRGDERRGAALHPRTGAPAARAAARRRRREQDARRLDRAAQRRDRSRRLWRARRRGFRRADPRRPLPPDRRAHRAAAARGRCGGRRPPARWRGLLCRDACAAYDDQPGRRRNPSHRPRAACRPDRAHGRTAQGARVTPTAAFANGSTRWARRRDSCSRTTTPVAPRCSPT